MINIVLAFAAGVVTIATPCIPPMLPILLGASIGQRNHRRPLIIVAGFVMALSVIALLFGAFPTVLGLSHDTVRDISIILLSGIGVLMLWPRPYELLFAGPNGSLAAVHDVGRRAGSGNWAGFVLGMALGFPTFTRTFRQDCNNAPLFNQIYAGCARPCRTSRRCGVRPVCGQR